MPRSPTTERLTAGEKRLTDVIDFRNAPKSSSSGENRARVRVDLIWDADPHRQSHEAG